MTETIHVLEGALRAGDALEVRTALADALCHGDVLITTSGVTSMDGAILQVLLSAQASAQQLERNLQIEIIKESPMARLRDRLALGAAL